MYYINTKIRHLEINNSGTQRYFVADVKTFSDYYPYGMQLPYRHGEDVYRYGFQGQEKDNEIRTGDGNSINFEFRMYDPRIGRFFARDPLAAKFPHNSSYAFSENRVLDAVELEGCEAKLIITDKIVGYTPQQIYGESRNIESGSYIVVPVYQMKLVDVNTGKVMGTFGVTRDAWYSRGEVEEDKYELVNRAFEPADGEVNLYQGVPLTYPNESFEAFTLKQRGEACVDAVEQSKEMNTYVNGTPIDDARSDRSKACGVMVHIGGWYNPGTGEKLAGSYGCFGVIEPDQIYKEKEHAQSMIDYNAVGKHGTTNDYYNEFIKKVIKVHNETKGEKKYFITVEKRDDVQKKQEISN